MTLTRRQRRSGWWRMYGHAVIVSSPRGPGLYEIVRHNDPWDILLPGLVGLRRIADARITEKYR